MDPELGLQRPALRQRLSLLSEFHERLLLVAPSAQEYVVLSLQLQPPSIENKASRKNKRYKLIQDFLLQMAKNKKIDEEHEWLEDTHCIVPG